MISVFDASEQTALRLRLAETLQAVISQRLLPRADGRGRVLAVDSVPPPSPHVALAARAWHGQR